MLCTPRCLHTFYLVVLFFVQALRYVLKCGLYASIYIPFFLAEVHHHEEGDSSGFGGPAQLMIMCRIRVYVELGITGVEVMDAKGLAI